MKLLASDFDGTLYFHDEDPSIRTKDVEAIKQFQALGHKFGICTGRPLSGITMITEGLIDFDFYILNNGSTILNKDQEVIYERYMQLNDVLKVLERFNDLDTMIVTHDHFYLYHPTRGWDDSRFKIIDDFNQIQEEHIMSFSFHVETEKDAKELVENINSMELPIIAYQNRNDVDCVYQECSKGCGIYFIKNYFLAEDDDVACIGDSYNDLPMLESVDKSFTFTNSPDTLKKHVYKVVDSINMCITELLEEA